MSAISHITLGTNDEQRAANFYGKVLGTLGFERLPKAEGLPPAFAKNGGMPIVYICTPIDDRPATWGNGTHVAFVADTQGQVHEFHKLALQLGGSNEGEPGPRPDYSDNYYAAYVRDPDGNKLQAVCYSGA